MNKNKQTGDYGEEIACRLLASKGFKILCRNFKSRYGELDIIADSGEILVFAEVKTRKYSSRYSPREAVDFRKQEKIIKTAYMYMMDYGGESQPRFDVVEVILANEQKVCSITHIEDAFRVS